MRKLSEEQWTKVLTAGLFLTVCCATSLAFMLMAFGVWKLAEWATCECNCW